MTNIIVDQGLVKSARIAFGLDAADPIDAMGFSDLANIAAGTTTIAAATNKQVNAFDVTPTIAGKVITCKGTLGANQLNGVALKVITIHRNGAGDSGGVHGGIDNLNLTKPAGVSLTATIDVTYSSP